MSCPEIRNSLAAYLYDELPETRAVSVERHLRACSGCSQALQAEHQLKEALYSRARIPAPSDGFSQRALAAATGRSRSSERRWSHGVLAGAVAAAMAFGMAVGVLFNGEAVSNHPAVAEQSLVPVERMVRLAFNAGEPLDNVTLTLELPPHVELAAMPGLHEVSWQVSLDAGENVLSLPLKVLFPGSGELVAHLDAGDRQKTFRAVIPAFESSQTGRPAS
ncbi:anti-sigma factor [Marinobacter salinexigens]|uniref:Anti-sigma factor n=2 Tax=Marinobacter salinexigens TaxID=2919747 RepID=A0A5B0V8L3_9GAMM|nr:anti-sigma factor [Marinobacter salinexigens]